MKKLLALLVAAMLLASVLPAVPAAAKTTPSLNNIQYEPAAYEPVNERVPAQVSPAAVSAGQTAVSAPKAELPAEPDSASLKSSTESIPETKPFTPKNPAVTHFVEEDEAMPDEAPVIAAPKPAGSVKLASTYDQYDVDMLSAFLLNRDADNVMNGEKVISNFTEANAADPAAWIVNSGYVIEWTEYNGKNYLLNVNFSNAGVVGSLELFGCQKLETVICDHNGITSVDLSFCPALTTIDLNVNSDLSVIEATDCRAYEPHGIYLQADDAVRYRLLQARYDHGHQ